jgi:hypothetical protein
MTGFQTEQKHYSTSQLDDKGSDKEIPDLDLDQDKKALSGSPKEDSFAVGEDSDEELGGKLISGG